MEIIRFDQVDFEQKLDKLYERPSYPAEIEDSVAQILDRVKLRGDAALSEYATKFDHVKLTPDEFKVTPDEVDAAAKQVSQAEKSAIELALRNIHVFAYRAIPKSWIYSPREGVRIGEQFSPLERIGVYIPGGSAPLVSTVIHTAGIAQVAGVREIIAVTPPGAEGKIHPAVLYAMKQAGVTDIYRLGGVYGIAAMAYGTQSIKKVQKIVGPGNAYVTAAKKLVYGEVAIDMVAGPSEIMIIADQSAKASHIAIDLLSQAEHGSGLEQSVLVTTDPALPALVAAEIEAQKQLLPKLEAVDKVLANGCFFIVAKDLNQACVIADSYAPEHLEIMTRNPELLAKKIKSAGAIFLGDWTPESLGDFCAGPSHVLPTAGSAKYFTGLRIEDFFRRSSIVEYTREALERENSVLEQFGQMEQLAAHGLAGSVRFKEKP